MVAMQLNAQKSAVFVSEGSAIHGYDPVAYFKEGKAVKGSMDLAFAWNGTTWNFSNRENLNSFRTSPDRYVPQY